MKSKKRRLHHQDDLQPDLFGGRQRSAFRESVHFYDRVLFLRLKRQCEVYRVSPRQSRVNGSLIDNRYMATLAEKLNYDPDWRHAELLPADHGRYLHLPPP